MLEMSFSYIIEYPSNKTSNVILVWRTSLIYRYQDGIKCIRKNRLSSKFLGDHPAQYTSYHRLCAQCIHIGLGYMCVRACVRARVMKGTTLSGKFIGFRSQSYWLLVFTSSRHGHSRKFCDHTDRLMSLRLVSAAISPSSHFAHIYVADRKANTCI